METDIDISLYNRTIPLIKFRSAKQKKRLRFRQGRSNGELVNNNLVVTLSDCVSSMGIYVIGFPRISNPFIWDIFTR